MWGFSVVPVAHADESALRVAARLQGRRTVASETLTWYGVQAKRGMPAIKAHGVLRNRIAVPVHDGLAAACQPTL